jgi:hypothetical protein
VVFLFLKTTDVLDGIAHMTRLLLLYYRFTAALLPLTKFGNPQMC